MATIIAQQGATTPFSGGADDLICRPSSVSRNGLTISCSTLLLNACTIEVASSGGDPDTITVSDAIHSVIVGEGFPIDYVRISGASAGTYEVTIA